MVAGCHTTGSYLEEEEAQRVTTTITTASELEQELGIPSVTVPMGGGKIKWVYDGVYTQAGAGTYIPYLNFLIGTNEQECTRLTVIVDMETGQLSDWSYSSEEDTDYWAKSDDSCKNKEEK